MPLFGSSPWLSWHLRCRHQPPYEIEVLKQLVSKMLDDARLISSLLSQYYYMETDSNELPQQSNVLLPSSRC